MIDERELVERAVRALVREEPPLDDLIKRRDRKRRNQRIAAGVVGIAVFAAAVWIVTSVGALDRSETSMVPGRDVTEPTETGPDEGFHRTGTGPDDEFRGRYRVIALDDACGFHSSWYRVRIRYVSERVRTYDRFAPGSGRPLRYVRGERFPWQRQGGSLVELRYDRRTDTAVGIQQGPQCPRWRVRLVPIG